MDHFKTAESQLDGSLFSPFEVLDLFLLRFLWNILSLRLRLCCGRRNHGAERVAEQLARLDQQSGGGVCLPTAWNRRRGRWRRGGEPECRCGDEEARRGDRLEQMEGDTVHGDGDVNEGSKRHCHTTKGWWSSPLGNILSIAINKLWMKLSIQFQNINLGFLGIHYPTSEHG